ncbi:hypothetical protein BH18ACI5_BH18ACI5_12820 [soil metagenome]
MCEYSSVDGFANDWHLVHLGSRAVGGAGALPLFIRISATDWTDGGWTGEDFVALAAQLKLLGVDVVDCSTGGNVARATIPVGPACQVRFAEQVKREAGILTAAVGMITDPQQAETIIASGQADLVLLARQFLRDPYFPLHAARQLGADPPVPVQYLRGSDSGLPRAGGWRIIPISRPRCSCRTQ